MSTYDRDPIDVAKDAIAFGEKQVKECQEYREVSRRQLEADEINLNVAQGYVRRWTEALEVLQRAEPEVKVYG